MNTQVSAALDNQDAVRVRRVDHAARVPGQKIHARFALSFGPDLTVTLGFAQLLELASDVYARIEEIAPSGAAGQNALAMIQRVEQIAPPVVLRAVEADEDKAVKRGLYCQPRCVVCGYRKAPAYRDVPAELAGSLCQRDTCDGYEMHPRANSRWMEETDADVRADAEEVGDAG